MPILGAVFAIGPDRRPRVHIDKSLVYLGAASTCAIVAAGYDIKLRKIPNKLTGPAIILGLLLHLVLDNWRGLLTAGAAGLIAGIVFLIFHLAGGMGGGDVKLIAAVACLAGLPNVIYLLILTSLAGGAMAAGFALIRGHIKQTLRNIVELVSHHSHEGLTPHPELNVTNANALRLPYGLAIAVGSFLTLYIQSIKR